MTNAGKCPRWRLGVEHLNKKGRDFYHILYLVRDGRVELPRSVYKTPILIPIDQSRILRYLYPGFRFRHGFLTSKSHNVHILLQL